MPEQPSDPAYPAVWLDCLQKCGQIHNTMCWSTQVAKQQDALMGQAVSQPAHMGQLQGQNLSSTPTGLHHPSL